MFGNWKRNRVNNSEHDDSLVTSNRTELRGRDNQRPMQRNATSPLPVQRSQSFTLLGDRQSLGLRSVIRVPAR